MGAAATADSAWCDCAIVGLVANHTPIANIVPARIMLPRASAADMAAATCAFA